MITKELKEKIQKIWNSTSRTVTQKRFTTEELNFMIDPHIFIWEYYNGCKKCVCGIPINTRKELISLKLGFMNLCAQCRIKNGRAIAQAVMIENGTHQSSDKHKNAVAKTKLERWGCIGYVNREKQKQTKLEKYGDENYSNQKQASATMLELYGAKRYAQTEIFRNNNSGIKNGTYKHFANLSDFNDEYIIEHFVSDEIFDVVKACAYFNCTYNTFKNKDYYLATSGKIGRSIETDLKIIFDTGFIYNTRKIISPLEIDFLNSGNNFGIEYNGLYWHSTIFKTQNYHLKKTELMESKGYQLFHIFENEWLEPRTKDIWLSVIKNKMCLCARIGARKCNIRELEPQETNIFLEKNHLQGGCRASVRIGLFYLNELVSVMTFGKSRYNKLYQYELIRFCSKLELTVQGGASKLLSYFEKTYNPESIISYANRRWSTGSLYETLGFDFTHNTTPNYFYFLPGENKLMSRIQFQKHKLKDKLETFDPELTETENMKNHGFNKIYDSGNKVYVLKY